MMLRVEQCCNPVGVGHRWVKQDWHAFYICSTWQRLGAAARLGTVCWPSLHWCPGQRLHHLTPCPREALAAPASGRGICPGHMAPLACFWMMEKLRCRWCHQHWRHHLMLHPCQSAICKSASLPRHTHKWCRVCPCSLQKHACCALLRQQSIAICASGCTSWPC